MRHRTRLGIVSAEFFDLSVGRLGGFGKMLQMAARHLRTHPETGIDLTLFHGFKGAPPDRCEVEVEGMRILLRPEAGSRLRTLAAYRSMVQAERLDALLTIDFYPSFRRTFFVLPRTPLIVWAIDPRTAEDWTRVATLRIPGTAVSPKGILPSDCTGFARVARLSRWLRRPLLIAAPDTFIADRVAATYGIRAPSVEHLPVLLDIVPGPAVKNQRPRVVFLGRLDPIKRPWIFVDLARAMPEVEFVCLGRAHYSGEGSWSPGDIPRNLRLIGHLDGQPKIDLLRSAWVLVNTSIHEALPISFLEALACETPIVSCQDAGGLVSRFGVYVGRFDGEGLESLPRFVEGVQVLLSDDERRARLGREGRAWVEATHSPAAFLRALDRLLSMAGIDRGSGAAGPSA